MVCYTQLAVKSTKPLNVHSTPTSYLFSLTHQRLYIITFLLSLNYLDFSLTELTLAKFTNCFNNCPNFYINILKFSQMYTMYFDHSQTHTISLIFLGTTMYLFINFVPLSFIIIETLSNN